MNPISRFTLAARRGGQTIIFVYKETPDAGDMEHGWVNPDAELPEDTVARKGFLQAPGVPTRLEFLPAGPQVSEDWVAFVPPDVVVDHTLDRVEYDGSKFTCLLDQTDTFYWKDRPVYLKMVLKKVEEGNSP